MNRTEIENKIRDFMKEGCAGADEIRFDALARELFYFQFKNNSFYRRFSEGQGKAPARIKSWQDIPFLPVPAFKTAYVASFPRDRVKCVFRTSGTTGSGRGELYLDDLSLYGQSLTVAFKYFCLPDLSKISMASLVPSFHRVGDSSLSFMISHVFSEYGTSRSDWFFENDKPDYDRTVKFLGELSQDGEPVMLFGTAIGFLDFLNYCDDRGVRFELPRRSRLMETGGPKGRKQKISKADLYKRFEITFGLDPVFCVNEYGMTEMGSQFYDTALRDHLFGETGEVEKCGPAWVKTRVINPMTGVEVECGHEGILCHMDLANVGSVLALETEDLGIRTKRGFEVIGRVPSSEPRGCSLASEEKLYV